MSEKINWNELAERTTELANRIRKIADEIAKLPAKRRLQEYIEIISKQTCEKPEEVLRNLKKGIAE